MLSKAGWVVAGVLALLVVAALTGVVSGGPLDPPGTPGPTGKTLTEVEPRTAVNTLAGSATAVHVINQPGSYYLTGNISGVAGKNGIEIAANRVTLDLNGFTLDGSTSASSLDGIIATASADYDIEILNGLVWAWSGDGIDLSNSLRNRITNVNSSDNTLNGIRGGEEALITGSVADTNGADGIAIAAGTVARCSVEGNGADGIEVGTQSLVEGNKVRGNPTNIHAMSGYNRIDGNHLTGGFLGIDVDAANNLIARNSFYGAFQASYDIVAGNAVGPFIAGNAAITSDNPWANFLYP